jgi:PAS domain S-box-containing protein
MNNESPFEDLYESFRQNAAKRFLEMEHTWKNELHEIVTLAAEICETPAAILTLTGVQQPLFIASASIDITDIERELTRFTETIKQAGVFTAEDTLNDARFAGSPCVTGYPYIRFYAGAALVNNLGQTQGCLYALHVKPGKLTNLQQTCLRMLAKQAMGVLDLHMSLRLANECITKIEHSEIRLRAVFESTGSNNILLGKNFEVLDFNKAVEEFLITAVGRAPAIGDDYRSYITAASMERFIDCFTRAMRGERTQGERLIAYPGLPPLWWEIIYAPARDGNGNIIGVSLQAKNINERKVFEEKIKEQNMQLRKIAQLQSHQVRGPLTAVMGIMNILKEDNGKTGEYLELMDTAIKQLDDNIHSIVQKTVNV